jgi:hypothetical protein
MSDLEQQLHRLSKERFESLVHQVLTAKYPSADINRAEGSGGDQGVDSFSGLLDIGAAIGQSKHFPDRIRDSQKKQIATSIQTAFKHKRPLGGRSAWRSIYGPPNAGGSNPRSSKLTAVPKKSN